MIQWNLYHHAGKIFVAVTLSDFSFYKKLWRLISALTYQAKFFLCRSIRFYFHGSRRKYENPKPFRHYV